jgi:hypothetical protein
MAAGVLGWLKDAWETASKVSDGPSYAVGMVTGIGCGFIVTWVTSRWVSTQLRSMLAEERAYVVTLQEQLVKQEKRIAKLHEARVPKRRGR